MPVGTAVQIGGELGLAEHIDLAMVSTSYDVGGEPSGRLGVIGPMRMDYGQAISAVEKVGDELGESLATDE
jgi:heat-inducible transcriptional repressor